MFKFMVFLTVVFGSFSGPDIYSIQFPDIAGKSIAMSTFKGKKVIVVVINAKSPDISYLRYMNQLQNRSNTYQIIAVPSTDFAGLAEPQRLDRVKTAEKLSIIIAKPAELTKAAKGKQHPLLAWLTNKDQNQHFDTDVDMTEKLFFVSEGGVLYGVLDKSASPEVLANTLKQNIK